MGVVEAIKASLSSLPQQSFALRHLLSGSWGTMLSNHSPHPHPYPTPIPDPPSHADGRGGGDQGLAVLAAPAVHCAALPAVRQRGHHALGCGPGGRQWGPGAGLQPGAVGRGGDARKARGRARDDVQGAAAVCACCMLPHACAAPAAHLPCIRPTARARCPLVQNPARVRRPPGTRR